MSNGSSWNGVCQGEKEGREGVYFVFFVFPITVEWIVQPFLLLFLPPGVASSQCPHLC